MTNGDSVIDRYFAIWNETAAGQRQSLAENETSCGPCERGETNRAPDSQPLERSSSSSGWNILVGPRNSLPDSQWKRGNYVQDEARL